MLSEEFVSEVIEHMNTDHAENLRDFAMAFGGVQVPNEVRMLNIDHQQMVLLCSGNGESTELTVPLLKPIERPEQLRGMMVAMAKRAREILVISPGQQG